jgi:hypothetical protein
MSDLDEELKSAEEALVDNEEALVDNEEAEVDNEESEVDNEESLEDQEVVERAKKYGHLSKEEWVAQGKDPSQWKSPKDFDKTGKVIEQLYSLKKKVDQRDREIQSLVEYQARTSQREYERAKQDLEQRLTQSKNDFNMEAVSHYTKEITKLESMEQSSKVQHQQQAQKSAQERFIERNAHWFNDRNVDLKNRAIEIDNELKNIYPNATYDELAQKIEARMQYEHPERVLGKSKGERPNISSSQSSVNKTSVNKSSINRTFQGLSQDLKDTYSATKRIVESNGDREYTQSDFIERLKKDGELK